MIRVIFYPGYMFLLLMFSGCNSRQYTLTIFTFRPDGHNGKEIHIISAANDSAAYSRAAILYYLSANAYRKISDNAKPYISKPVNFILLDESGRSVDSILGIEKTTLIRETSGIPVN